MGFMQEFAGELMIGKGALEAERQPDIQLQDHVRPLHLPRVKT